MNDARTFEPVVRWGVLGTGLVLEKLGPSLRLARGVDCVAIASRDHARATAAAAAHGIAQAYQGYDQLLDDPAIDVVLNALHNGLHCEWTVRALAAGKHVLCEKPLGRGLVEVEEMYRAAARHDRWLLEGFMYRFHPQWRAVDNLIASGAIGQLQHLRAAYLGRGRERKNPRYRRDTGGGVLLDLGCYCVNVLRRFAGTEPQRVRGHARCDDETGVDLTFAGMLEFPRGLSGHFSTSFESAGLYGLDIIGTDGRLHVPHPWRPPAWPAELCLSRDGTTETVVVDADGKPQDPLLPFVLEIEHLSDCVRRGQPPRYPDGADAQRDAHHNARVLDQLAADAGLKTTTGG